jgi:hypothetical protein
MILRGIGGLELGDLDTEKLVFTKIADEHTRQDKPSAGWAVEIGVVDMLFLLNCNEIHIVDSGAQKTYRITLESLTKHGVMIESDYGQKILAADEHWEVVASEN